MGTPRWGSPSLNRTHVGPGPWFFPSGTVWPCTPTCRVDYKAPEALGLRLMVILWVLWLGPGSGKVA